MLPTIERYELTNEIGHGGMATVYRARDTRLDRWVAVKVMHPHLRGTEQARARFSREARAVAKLRHPAILEIYDYSGNESDNAYIATELLTGPTLRAYVDSTGEIPAEIAACICCELAAALAAAHAQGIVHRDVKPENVLLHENRTVKLTDFGIADMLDPTMSAMTATGQLLGSPAHMAPEQVESGDADARSDVFALGTILYWLTTGVLPFSGKNPHQVLKRVVECQPLDPLALRPSIGRPLRDLICRCLSKSPNDRFQTAQDLADELARHLATVGIADPRATLEAYFHDPKTEEVQLRERVIDALLAEARKAVAVRDRMAAIVALDRVLALHDAHAEALKLVGQLDHADRTRKVVRAGIAALAIAAVAGLWVSFAPKSGARRGDDLPGEVDELQLPDPSRRPEPTAVTPTPGPITAEDAAVAKVVRPAPKPVASKLRTVVFDPSPPNVTIAVDGAEPKAYGPSFRMVELAPGPHSFSFTGGHECCKPLTVEREVPGGTGEYVVSAKLEFRDAYVRVDSVPADVVVDDGLAAGRSLLLLAIPMKQLVERHRISVTAPGFEPYTGWVDVRAGVPTSHPVSLKPRDPR
ncbi:MAG: serine/threonine-protein kinase [Polyangiales bacterium]